MPTDPLTIVEREFVNALRQRIAAAEESGTLAETGDWTNDEMKQAIVIIDRLAYLLPGQSRRGMR